MVDELDLVEDEQEGNARGLGVDEEPGERGGLGLRLVEREEEDDAVDVGDGRVGDLGAAVEDVLDDAAAAGPVDGPDEHPVPDEHAAADLLEQRAHDAEQVGAPVVLQARGRGGDDDAHEVGLGGGHEPRGLGREERVGGGWRGGACGWWRQEEARVAGGGAAGEVEAVGEREAEVEAGQRGGGGRRGWEERHFGGAGSG